jgi:hypothetical protein
MKKALIIMAVIIAFIWIKIKSDNLDANKFWNDAITPKEDNTLKMPEKNRSVKVM